MDQNCIFGLLIFVRTKGIISLSHVKFQLWLYWSVSHLIEFNYQQGKILSFTLLLLSKHNSACTLYHIN